LAKLICFCDDNGISIDGAVAGWFTDDTPKRFEAYGWHVIPDVDGHDVDAVDRAIREAHSSSDRPTLICCKTTIGKGSPNRAGTDLAHGQALGEKEVSLTRARWVGPHRRSRYLLRRTKAGTHAVRRAPAKGLGRALCRIPRRTSRQGGGIRSPDGEAAFRGIIRSGPPR
jgi:transketolase